MKLKMIFLALLIFNLGCERSDRSQVDVPKRIHMKIYPLGGVSGIVPFSTKFLIKFVNLKVGRLYKIRFFPFSIVSSHVNKEYNFTYSEGVSIEISYTYDSSGSFVSKFELYDDNSKKDENYLIVKCYKNVPPYISFVQVSTQWGITPLPISVRVSAYDPDG